jgi:predicted nucleic acid-binding Zn ribbon protein
MMVKRGTEPMPDVPMYAFHCPYCGAQEERHAPNLHARRPSIGTQCHTCGDYVRITLTPEGLRSGPDVVRRQH